jgi:phage terminase small subunit
MLTEKQKNFCRNIVSGMNNAEAYIQAYNSKAQLQTAYNEAYKLMLKDDIQAYIKHLSKPLEEVTQITTLNARQEQINFIKERIDICKAKDDEQSIIRYTEILNKLYGLYKDTEQEEKQENTVNTLDTATLIKLSGSA